MKFNSQICTTKKQSERLLALGLKKETADCRICPLIVNPNQYLIMDMGIQPLDEDETPAWSLHRLMCLCPTDIDRHKYAFYVSHDYVYYLDIITGYNDDKPVGFFKDNPFDSLIDCIEWLIKEGYFNKEYLEERV